MDEETSTEELIKKLQNGDNQSRGRAALLLTRREDERAIEPLFKALKDPLHDVRFHAAIGLSQFGPKVEERLLQAFNDPDEEIRTGVIVALRNSDNPQVVEVVLAGLKDESRSVRWRAAEAAGQFKLAQAIEPLLEFTLDKDLGIYEVARDALVKIGDPVVEPLLEKLQNKTANTDLRIIAIYVLSRLETRPEQLAELLVRIVQDKTEAFDVRDMVVINLARFKDEPVVKPLIEIITDKSEQSKLRTNALYSLGKLEAKEALEPVLALFKDESEPKDLRRYARNTLGELGDMQVFGLLVDEFKKERDPGDLGVAYSIAKLGEPAVLPLIELLNNKTEDERVRTGAAEALGEIQDTRTIEPLMQALKNESGRIKAYAASGLGRKRVQAAVPLLIEALKDKDEKVRAKAIFALNQIGDINALESVLNCYKDESPWVRAGVAHSDLFLMRSPQNKELKNLYAEKVVEVLTELTKDPDGWVRQSAIRRWIMLPQIKLVTVEEATQVLVNLLENDESRQIRQDVAQILGRVGDESALPALERVLQDDKEIFLGTPQITISQAATGAIRQIKERYSHPE